MSWKPIYGLLLLTSTVVDFYSSHKIARVKTPRTKKLFLLLSLAVNFGLLFTFKYLDFSFEILNLATSGGVQFDPLDLILPIGISFYTFQTVSYTIDVYRGEIEPENNFIKFALFVSFFPQLVAGPIEKAGRLLPQFERTVAFDYERIRFGAFRILKGFFKKLVIADSLGKVSDQIFFDPQSYEGIFLIIGIISFAIQILMDFWGYSDIALGCAKILGFDLMENFRSPFLARNISDFWGRLHISLSKWFRSYVYIPLGGSKRGLFRQLLSLWVAWTLSGIWHGANFTFIFWGTFYFLASSFGILTKGIRAKIVGWLFLDRVPLLLRGLQSVKVFALYSLSGVFFRANTLSDSYYIFTNLFTGLYMQISNFSGGLIADRLGDNTRYLCIGLLFHCLLEVAHVFKERVDLDNWLLNQGVTIRWGAYILICLSIIFFGNFEGTQFVYFQF